MWDHVTVYILYYSNNICLSQPHCFAPRFSKMKDEGWWLIIGDIEEQELVVLKRVGFVRRQTTANLSFYTPDTPGRKVYTLYVMSDCYLGLDQQYDIHVEINDT